MLSKDEREIVSNWASFHPFDFGAQMTVMTLMRHGGPTIQCGPPLRILGLGVLRTTGFHLPSGYSFIAIPLSSFMRTSTSRTSCRPRRKGAAWNSRSPAHDLSRS